MPSHMTSVQSYNFGTEIKLLDPAILEGWNVALRTGYSHSETPIPNFTFTPTVPDSNLNLASVGFGLDCHNGGYFLGLFECGRGGGLRPTTIGIDLAFQAIIFEPRKVISSLYSGVKGNYESAAFAGSLNINLSY